MRILLVDHEDSFVHNIEQALTREGTTVRCVRSTVPLDRVLPFDPDAIVLSPGPGHPSDRRLTALSRRLLRRWDDERPFLGVCLGHQLIAEHYGARVGRAPEPVHGDVSRVDHDGRTIFAGIPSPMEAARYHSLVVRRTSIPNSLEISAWGEDRLVMGLRHRSRAVESVQFHPESYLTRDGPRLFRNFLRGVRR